MKKNFFFAAMFLGLACCNFLFAEMSFLSSDLNEKGDILFSVKTDIKNSYSYDTLFLFSKEKNKIEQLTFFAEKLDFFKNTGTLQISNSFGIIRIDANSKHISLQEDFLPFFSRSALHFRYLNSIETSPDGRWITMIEPFSAVYGKLILFDTLTERRYVLSEKTVRNSKPVCWAPDSSIILYEDQDILYFARPEWFNLKQTLDKKFRQLGKTSVKTVRWISSNEFIFMSGNVFYKANSSELFTKSFYYPLFQAGQFIARLPFEFNPSSDIISISPDGKTALFINAKRNTYFLQLTGDDYLEKQKSLVIPYLLLPGSTAEISIHWKNNLPVLFLNSIHNGKNILSAWKISSKTFVFEKINLPQDISFFSASPDFKIVSMKEKNSISFYDTEKWIPINSFDDEKIFSSMWKDSNTVFLGGENSVFKYTIDNEGTLLNKERFCISSIKDYSWSDSGSKILIKVKTSDSEEILESDGKKNWKKTLQTELFKKKNSNADNRIYIDSGLGYFKNMIYIRSLHDFTTKPLFEEPSVFAASLNTLKDTASEYGNSLQVFSHGNRKGKKHVALAFDVVDNMTGIAEVLYILKNYNIKATFFVNGEAVKQSPNAVKEIVSAGHQCGSLFFTSWDLNDLSYKVDEAFVRQGLARNEDLFYSLTGTELSLIWHTPNYITSSMIVNAGKKAGYIYISPDIRTPDWINSKAENVLPQLYKSSAQIIDDIYSDIAPGSIIPIRLGKTDLQRKDYIYSQLELLINVITEKGYSITDIKTLMNEN